MNLLVFEVAGREAGSIEDDVVFAGGNVRDPKVAAGRGDRCPWGSAAGGPERDPYSGDRGFAFRLAHHPAADRDSRRQQDAPQLLRRPAASLLSVWRDPQDPARQAGCRDLEQPLGAP